MEDYKSTAGQGFGVAGLVLGIISLLIAFIPCIGVFALLPGIIAIAFSIIALNQANKANGAKGLIIAALVISIMSTLLAALWIFALQQGGQWVKKHSHDSIEQTINEGLNESLGPIKEDMEKKMEELEASDSTALHFNLEKDMSNENFDQFLKQYDALLSKTSNELKNIDTKDSHSVLNYSKNAVKLAKIMAQVALLSQELTPEQNERIEVINKKYKFQLDKHHKNKP